MKMIHNPTFSKSLKQTLKHITNDKPLASLNFKEELKKKIKKLPNNPYMCPPSRYFEENNVRDITYNHIRNQSSRRNHRNIRYF